MNVYIPMENVTRVCEESLSQLRVGSSYVQWLMCEDFKGRHLALDGVSANARATHMLEWSDGSDLLLMNDDSVTRVRDTFP